jgi:Tol biopolymer transport system component
MHPERWKQIEEVYYSILAAPSEERGALLARTCPDDSELRREVESLLRSEDHAGDFLSSDKLHGHIARIRTDWQLPALGTRLGDYEILGLLGAGAMGEVYRARDVRLGREVALKILPPHLTSDPARVARFQSEARAASALNHPNAVTIYEIGQASGTWFIAEELIEGVTLREYLKNRKPTADEAAAIAIQCADMLAVAHRAGVVHRDIKPENIMIRSDGVAKVVDFGLARIAGPRPDGQLEATQTGSIMGTPRYMSPEQARGLKTDARSDIFSLGAVLFEVVAGRPAFPGSNAPEVFAALLSSEPDLADAGALGTVLAKALAKDPAARYQTIEEFARDLREPHLAAASARRPGLTSKRLTRIAAAAVVLAVAGGLAAVWAIRHAKPGDTNPRFTQLTALAGHKEYPAFSPDGGRIAFAWRPSGKETRHIYVKPVGAGEPVQLTFGSSEETFPVWSPDGARIAFCRGTLSPDERALVASAVYTISPAGGPPRKIADGCGGISWSPDGSTLAVARVPNQTPNSGGIDLLFLKSGERRRLTSAREDLLPAYSPNGEWIAFIRVGSGRGRGREVFAVPAAGGRAHQLTSDGAYVTGATWTADSREIVFSSPRNPTEGSFWRVSVSGGTPRPVSEALRNASHPSISRQGSRMVFTESFRDTNLYLRTGPGFPHAGTPWRFEAPAGIVLSTGTEHNPVFSPDGEHFAFVSDRTGTNQIWAARRDGSEVMQLTSTGNRPAGSPRWSPDGQWVAFDVWASSESNVYVVSSRGGAIRRVSMEPGESWNAAWSHDGAWIYFTSSRSGDRQIWKTPLAGGRAIQVTHTGADEARPSPDGNAVYFRKSTPAGCCEIWSVPVAGGPEEAVPELKGFTTVSRSWCVQNQGIYFIARQNEPRQKVRLLNFATREVADVVTLEKDPDWDFLGLAVSPDGRSLLTVQIDREADDLMLMENFR